jgi:quinohemoprotein amine dehydrogenase
MTPESRVLTAFAFALGAASIVALEARVSPAPYRFQRGAARSASGEAQGTPVQTLHESDGIPVSNPLVQGKCAACHRADATGRMTRISYRRTTPEGWQETVRRMVALNQVRLTPEEARDIVRYLSTNHGLAPEEARPAAFEVERRSIDYTYAADKETGETCTKCHSFGRVLSQRRTRQEWDLLLAMHRGLYPLVDTQAFRRTGRPSREAGPDGRPPDNRHPMDKAAAHLSAAFPLRTPEWSAWSATMRSPVLAGRWALSGHDPGRGPIFGEVVITQASGPGRERGDAEVATEIRYVAPRSGQRVERRGQAIVYTGFQWRGRSTDAANPASALREVMFVERDWRRMSGRWFTGAYDELGLDVTLVRIGADPILLGTDSPRLRAGVAAQQVRLYGANLPANVQPADVDLGPGVTVARVLEATPQALTVQVDVGSEAPVGMRDVFVAGSSARAVVAVYERIDAIRIGPRTGMARVGGENFPKQYQQFEASAFASGPDGKPDTPDDIPLGLVDAAWSLEEYTATYNDDDRLFVGTIDATSGLFTPNVDGPNPKRRNNANNYGDVWVVATYEPPGANPTDRPLRARAHLLVTVPLYMRWEAVEAGR